MLSYVRIFQKQNTRMIRSLWYAYSISRSCAL